MLISAYIVRSQLFRPRNIKREDLVWQWRGVSTIADDRWVRLEDGDDEAEPESPPPFEPEPRTYQ